MNIQGDSYRYLLEQTDQKVEWAYEVWDDLLELLRSQENRARSISGQLLCNLAKNDVKDRMKQDFETLIAATKDKSFVTARHILQSLWKVGIARKQLTEIVVSGLSQRYMDCENERNGTLIRYDIIINLRKMFDALKYENIKEKALGLIEKEQEEKYKKKYLKEWKGA